MVTDKENFSWEKTRRILRRWVKWGIVYNLGLLIGGVFVVIIPILQPWIILSLFDIRDTIKILFLVTCVSISYFIPLNALLLLTALFEVYLFWMGVRKKKLGIILFLLLILLSIAITTEFIYRPIETMRTEAIRRGD